MKKLTKANINDLVVLLSHARYDLDFREAGSYLKTKKSGEEVFDAKEGRQSKRAINIIQRMILLN